MISISQLHSSRFDKIVFSIVDVFKVAPGLRGGSKPSSILAAEFPVLQVPAHQVRLDTMTGANRCLQPWKLTASIAKTDKPNYPGAYFYANILRWVFRL